MRPSSKTDAKMLTEAYTQVRPVTEANLFANLKANTAGLVGKLTGTGDIAKLRSIQKSINAKFDTALNDITSLLKSNQIPVQPTDIAALKTALNQLIETNLIQKIAPTLSAQQQQQALAAKPAAPPTTNLFASPAPAGTPPAAGTGGAPAGGSSPAPTTP